MAEDTSNQLRFSIEESVWLDKGQGVDEILSMALEPDISVVENKHYVSVRGALKLTGEFRSLEADEESEEIPMDDDRPPREQTGARTVDEMSMSEDGTAQIEHHFPVDITIPLSRIDRLADIYVMVNSFDYTLPENDCIRLDADISISGMMEEHPQQQQAEEVEVDPEPVDEEMAAEVSEVRKKDAEVESVQEQDREEESVEEVAEEEEVHEPFHYEAIRDTVQNEQDEGSGEEIEQSEQGPLVEMKSRTNEMEEPLAIVPDLKNPTGDVEEGVQGGETTPEPEEPVDEEVEARPQREENALYLTKMLTKEEEQFSRLKMCIIQPGDSLDKIADRYELTLGQLIRVNQLESEDVEEGQILYIPVSV